MEDVKFCFCGLYVRPDKYGTQHCPKHGANPPSFDEVERREKIGRYSGQSKSEHKFGDYQ